EERAAQQWARGDVGDLVSGRVRRGRVDQLASVLERAAEVPELRPVLEGPKPAVAPEGREAGGDDHWRVVRQPEPLRRAAGGQAHRGAEPADYELDGLRRLGARRLGARRGGEPRRRALRLRDVSVL